MPSIGDVGGELWQVHEKVEATAATVRAAADTLNEATAHMGIAMERSSHPLGEEGLSQWRQALGVFEEVLRLFAGGNSTLGTYIASITVRGPGGSRRHPDGAYRTADGKYAGIHGPSRSGADAEAEAHNRFRRRNYEVDERQQYTATTETITGTILSGPRQGPLTLPAGAVRKYDGAVKIRGKWYGIETKGGSASKTPEQRAIDEWLKRPGNSLTTADGKVLEGVQEVRIKYTEEGKG